MAWHSEWLPAARGSAWTPPQAASASACTGCPAWSHLQQQQAGKVAWLATVGQVAPDWGAAAGRLSSRLAAPADNTAACVHQQNHGSDEACSKRVTCKHMLKHHLINSCDSACVQWFKQCSGNALCSIRQSAVATRAVSLVPCGWGKGGSKLPNLCSSLALKLSKNPCGERGLGWSEVGDMKGLMWWIKNGVWKRGEGGGRLRGEGAS